MTEDNIQINTIIIEDQYKSQEYLTSIIQKNFNNIKINGFAENIKDSIALINKVNPELILMDIELEDGLSFEIFKSLNNYDFEIIFITAHSNYLQSALNHYAFSFVTKPIDENKLINIIDKYIRLKQRIFSQAKYSVFENFIKNNNPNLLINTGKEHIYLTINEIIKIEARGNYALFFTDKKQHLASNTLKYYESLLIEKGFFKPNRSILINTKYIQSIYKKESIILKNRQSINVSTRNRPKLLELIKLLS